MRKALLVACFIFGSMVLAAISSSFRPDGLLRFAAKADDLIDARMAATLAGLSLAAASFTRDIERRPAELERDFAERVLLNARSTNLLVRAFYVFTFVLAVGLSWDAVAQPQAIESWVDLSAWAELVISGAGLSFGLGLLVAGAHGLVTPEGELETEARRSAK